MRGPNQRPLQARRALAAVLLVTGCASPGSQSIVGPDGSPMAHVHCGTDQGSCFRIAGELCPGGYELQPVLRGADGNFLVRCRLPAPTASLGCVAAARLPAAPLAAPANQSWPPAAEPAPAADPWPAPRVASSAPLPNVPAPAAEIDLGY